MAAKAKTPARATAPPVVAEPPVAFAAVAPRTTEERILRIAAMGQRIDGYIQFMCQVGNLAGTSAEAKEKAITAFYDRLLILERQLGRIQEELQLG
jgi:hypothetical protein